MGGIAAAVEFYGTRADAEPHRAWNPSSPDTRSSPRCTRLAEVCDSETKVVVIGHYNDISLYRELIRSGVSEYLVGADLDGRFHDGDLRHLRRSGRRAARPVDRLHRRQGRRRLLDHLPQCRLVDLLAVPAATSCWPISTLPSARRTSTSTRIRRRASPRRCSRRSGSTTSMLDRLLAKCAEHLSLLAAPSTLDRIYDFDKNAFAQILDSAQRSAPCVVLDVPHVWNGWTRQIAGRGRRGGDHGLPGTRQPAQRQEPDRHAGGAAARTTTAAADHQPGRRAEASGDQRQRFRRAARRGADGGHSVRAGACSARRPTTAR